MSVYTTLTADDLIALLASYDLGAYVGHQGISAGMENTNYFVSTDQGVYVLTLFEQYPFDEVQRFARLVRHFAAQNLPVPAPLSNRSGHCIQQLFDKPVVLCPRFYGDHPKQITVAHCQAMGAMLAQLHWAARTLMPRRANDRGLLWWGSAGPSLVATLSSEERKVFSDELAYQQAHQSQWQALPQGWVHSDLFHDNVLFDGVRLSAVLDWYNACEDAWLYDLAVIANDWCCNLEGVWHEGCVEALLSSYAQVRPLQDAEYHAWPLVLRGAALRFWLSRLLSQQQQATLQASEHALIATKDPNEYLHKLIARRSAIALGQQRF